MPTDSKPLKSVLVARFLRCGGRGKVTLPFDEFSEHVQRELLGRTGLRPSESPIVASVLSKESWFLITTERVFALLKGRLFDLENADIKDATGLIDENVGQGRQKKDELLALRVETFGGIREIVEIEPGAGYLGIWNVLKWIAQRNWDRVPGKQAARGLGGGTFWPRRGSEKQG